MAASASHEARPPDKTALVTLRSASGGKSLLCFGRLPDLRCKEGFALRLSVLDQSVAVVGPPARAIHPRYHRAGAVCRDARLRALLGVGASQSRHHRRHGARDPDGGHRGHHPAHPHRQRRRDAAALCAAQGGRAVPGAGFDCAGPHRSRPRARAGLRRANGLRLEPDGERAPGAVSQRRARPDGVGLGLAAARGTSVRCGEGLSAGRDVARDLDARQLRLRRAGGGTLRAALCVRVVLHGRQGRRRKR